MPMFPSFQVASFQVSSFQIPAYHAQLKQSFRVSTLVTLLAPLVLPSIANAALPADKNSEKPPQSLFSTQSPTGSSSQASYQALYQQQALIEKLARTRGWLRLLYYPDPSKSSSKKPYQSRIHNANFFLSPTGNTDPQAEMTALLTALLSQNAKNTPPSQAAQCRFPARTHWLMQQLNISPSAVPAIGCDEMASWMREFNPSQVSLIFAEEYLENPASAFGHSFLRFDNASTGQAKILNYVPKTIPDESFLKFSYKSIIAGNTGEFTLEPYEQKITQYLDQEGRDIWRYPLNLTTEERQQLARVVWEIKDQHLTYLLTKDNCASEILALLNVLRPEQNYLAGYHAIVAPADIVRSLQRQKVITGEPIYEPSKKSQHQAQLNKIGNEKLKPAPFAFDNNPLNAQALSRFSAGIGQQQHKTFGELGYRLVYHDALDGRNGYPSGFYLEGLSAKVRYFSNLVSHNDDKLQLENFTLLKARSLNPVNTADNGKSWGGHLALERITDGQTSHLVGSLGAEYGWSVAYGRSPAGTTALPPNICYGLGTGDIQLGKGLAQNNRLGVGAILGCVQQFSPSWRAIMETTLPYWYEAGRDGSNGYWQPKASMGVQHDLSQRQSLRLTGQYTWQPKIRQTSAMTLGSETHNTPELLLQYLRYF